MKLRFTRRALANAKRIKTWWQKNRPAARDLFELELEAALDRIRATPILGSAYHARGFDVPVRRVLLPKTHNHVYYAVENGQIVVLAIWGARKERGPVL